MSVSMKVHQLPHASGLKLPEYQTEGSSGLDLLAAVDQDVVIAPKGTAMVPTGLRVALPEGTEGQVRPRSGLAAKKGVTVLNSPGTVDQDYRGEIKVILINHGPNEVVIGRGERIAQFVVAPIIQVGLEQVDGSVFDTLATDRGAGGFGSTGH